MLYMIYMYSSCLVSTYYVLGTQFSVLYINFSSQHLSEVGNYYFTCFTDEDTKALRSFMTLSRSLRQQMAEVKFNSRDWLESTSEFGYYTASFVFSLF